MNHKRNRKTVIFSILLSCVLLTQTVCAQELHTVNHKTLSSSEHSSSDNEQSSENSSSDNEQSPESSSSDNEQSSDNSSSDNEQSSESSSSDNEQSSDNSSSDNEQSPENSSSDNEQSSDNSSSDNEQSSDNSSSDNEQSPESSSSDNEQSSESSSSDNQQSSEQSSSSNEQSSEQTHTNAANDILRSPIECTCSIKCLDLLNPNPNCPHCSQGGLNPISCTGPMPDCTCTQKCSSQSAGTASGCVLCQATGWYADYCAGAESSEPSGCICTAKCLPTEINPDCQFCNETPLNILSCTGDDCICEWLCYTKEYADNSNCNYCKASNTHMYYCNGTACTCLKQCTPDTLNSDCLFCMAGQPCIALPCTCTYKCDSEIHAEFIYECIVCASLAITGQSFEPCDGDGAISSADIQQLIDDGSGQINIELATRTIIIDKMINIPEGKQVVITASPKFSADAVFSLTRDVTCNKDPLFKIENGGSLTLDPNIILDGNGRFLTSYAPLITIKSGGKLTQNGAVIKDNENLGGMGGGVYVASGGELVMQNGAKIIENEAVSGGGVYLEDGAKMSVSGSVQVTDNNAGTQNKNVFFAAAQGRPPIHIQSGGVYGAKIGISAEALSSPFAFAHKDSTVTDIDCSAFYCDAVSTEISKNGSSLIISPLATSTHSGKVVLDGKAVENALITVKSRVNGDILYKTSTDKNGEFFIEVPKQNNSLRILASSVLDYNGQMGNYSAAADFTARSSYTLELKPGNIVSGLVSGEGGMSASQIDGAVLTFRDSKGNIVSGTVTCYGGGHYDAILPESSNTYHAVVKTLDNQYSGSGYVTIGTGAAKGTDITMRKGMVKSGTVYLEDGSGPAADALIVFTNSADVQNIRALMLSADFVPENSSMIFAYTDANGKFEAGGLESASLYSIIAISNDGAQTLVKTNLLIPNSLSLTLESTLPAKGKIAYFKDYLNAIAPEPPQLLSLEVKNSQGFRMIVPIDSATGEFTLTLPDGDYELEAFSTVNPNERISGNGAVLTVHQGDYDLALAGKNPEDNPLITYKNFTNFPFSEDNYRIKSKSQEADNTIIVQLTPGLGDIWVYFESLLKIDIDKFDSQSADHMKTLRQASDYYKSITTWERDMLPWRLPQHMNDIYDKLAAEYKVTIKNNNQYTKAVKSFGTGLGDESNTTPAGQRIGCAEGIIHNKQDQGITIIPTISPSSVSEQQLITSAVQSGEVLECFDLSLKGKFDDEDKDFYITKLNESIKVNIALNKEHNSGTYKVVRFHNGAVTALEAQYDAATGSYSFWTDRFSTYAVVTSQPGKGIVITESPDVEEELPEPTEPSEPSENQDPSGGSSKQSGGKSKASEKASYDNQYNFWSNARTRIAKASTGDTITLNADGYDKIPSYVIAALAGKNVTVIIQYGNGQTIALNGQNLPTEGSKLYYSIDELTASSVEIPEEIEIPEETEAAEEAETPSREDGSKTRKSSEKNSDFTDENSTAEDKNLLVAGAGNFQDKPPQNPNQQQAGLLNENPAAQNAEELLTPKADKDNIIRTTAAATVVVFGGGSALWWFIKKRALYLFHK